MRGHNTYFASQNGYCVPALPRVEFGIVSPYYQADRGPAVPMALDFAGEAQPRRLGFTSVRMIPRMACTSRVDQPALVSRVRIVWRVTGVRSGG